MTALTEAQQRWKQHIDAAKAANQTLAEYARAHALNLQTLYSHSRKLNKPDNKPTRRAFVKVQRSAPTTTPGNVRIEFKNGVRVHMDGPMDLASLLAQVAQLP